MRNLYTAVAANAPAVTMAVKTIFAHTDPEEGRRSVRTASPTLLCRPW